MEQTRRVNTRTASQVRGLHKYTSEPMRNESWRSFPTERDCDESIEDFGLQQIGGAPLKEAALNRIERLADRIRLYALSEIEECLNEKETLTFLVFNLIAIKDSHAVGKLTRSSCSTFQVSLMTSYFSTEIDDLKALLYRQKLLGLLRSDHVLVRCRTLFVRMDPQCYWWQVNTSVYKKALHAGAESSAAKEGEELLVI
ncbi:hypothetical protein CIHG_09558 [Coccidioides immitis H538.4]|uniref:Uncharacterized protein n=1 Tax=Coccidioides immitis H538.4 TaxID=396776 RepID=A0A0J8UVD3_COCIT|nr:hypothetical protein CIHG_09558 [Coccidioides immitis H538.4]